MLDSGAAAIAWVTWAGCTEGFCTSHPAQYTPSDGPDFHNFSTVDSAQFTDFGNGSTTI
jgi:hypothetical protein